MCRVRSGLFACVFVLWPVEALAQRSPRLPASEDYETPRSLALGLGARASALSTAALANNPANLALARLYHLEGALGYVPQHRQFSFGAAVVDSFSSWLAMGIQYRYLLGNGEYGHSGMDGRIGLAIALSEAFSMGVVGRYHSLVREGQIEGDL
ncbi:MAG: hypothetical protein N2515_10600, partial [Deltaproteobacteria bacterium]|nr:hypothetical protein [Deltaproteobacteria bacterium]